MEIRVGVDVGGTRLRLAGWDGEKILCPVTLPRAATEGELTSAIGHYIEEYFPGGAASVAVGIPGTLDKTRRAVLNTPNLDLGGTALADTLEAALGVPVTLDKDSNMLLRGDVALLGRGGEGLTLGIYIGTGLGGAVFLNGRPLPGKNGVSELGHMPVAGRRERCGCGNRGCAENYVSGRRLLEIGDEIAPGQEVSGLFLRHGAHPLLEGFLDDLAAVAACAVNLLDPSLVIIGGGVAAMEGFPRQRVINALRERCMHPVPADTLEVIFSGNQPFLGALGAALTASPE